MTKKAIWKIKKNLTLCKRDYLILEIHKSIYKLIAIFTTLQFLICFNAKRQINLKTDALGYALFSILLQKQKSE